ncbi:hypothetical protein ES705_47209 [subsurface metagenome]
MFGNKKEKEEELRLKVVEWWRELPYLKKIEILLAQGTKPDGYPTYDITTIEHIGVRVMWNYRTLEQKNEIMQKWEKQKKEGR